MTREQWHDHLAVAQHHVRNGAQRVAQQAVLVARLRADGRDTTAAQALLELFLQILTAMRAHVHFIRNKQ